MKRLIGSGLGLGLLPAAPGTWASAAVLAAFAGGRLLWPGQAQGAWRWLLAPAVAAVLAALSVAVGNRLQEKDPRWFVLDELAGQALALTGAATLAQAAISFVFFRAFDIMKPWPLRRLEGLPAGWGITADDLAAGALSVLARLVVLLAAGHPGA